MKDNSIFNHPAFPEYANLYSVSITGTVRRLDSGNGWGDRQVQSDIVMRKPGHKEKVSNMAREYYGTEEKEKYIAAHPFSTNKELAEHLKCSNAAISVIRKKN